MTSMPASLRARAMILAPLSWPSRPTFATTTLIVCAIAPPFYPGPTFRRHPSSVGEDLARVHDVVRVGQPLYLPHERQGVAVLFSQVPGLSEADAVLPR